MDIGSGNDWPACTLSNFAPHPFIFDGVACSSMEGFLQSLKFSNPDMQQHVCTLIGFKAKLKGKNKPWYKTQKLHWKDREIDRHSDEYQELLDGAFEALSGNSGFANALLATGSATLRHSMGKSDAHRTVLTKQEFCSRLTRLRDKLRRNKPNNKKGVETA